MNKCLYVKGPNGIPLPVAYRIAGKVIKVMDLKKEPMLEVYPITNVAVQTPQGVKMPMTYFNEEIPFFMMFEMELVQDPNIVNVVLPELMQWVNTNAQLKVVSLEAFNGSSKTAMTKAKAVGEHFHRTLREMPVVPKHQVVKEEMQAQQLRQPTVAQPTVAQPTVAQPTVNQDKEIQGLREELDLANKNLNNLKQEVSSKDNELVSLRSTLEESTRTIENQKKEIAEKEQVENLLNRLGYKVQEDSIIEIETGHDIQDMKSRLMELEHKVKEEPSVADKLEQEMEKKIVEEEIKEEEIIPQEPEWEPPAIEIKQPPKLTLRNEPTEEKEIDLSWDKQEEVLETPITPTAQDTVSEQQVVPTTQATVVEERTTTDEVKTVAKVLNIDEGNPWDYVVQKVVEGEPSSFIGLRDVEHANQTIKDWVDNGEYAQPESLEVGRRLNMFFNLEGHHNFEMLDVMERFKNMFGDFKVVYLMTTIAIKKDKIKGPESDSKLYFGLPYFHFIYSLVIERHLNFKPSTMEYYNRIMWVSKYVGSTKINIADEGEDFDQNEEVSDFIVIDSSDRMIATAKNETPYLIEHLLQSLNGTEYKGVKMHGVDAIRYAFVMSESGKPSIVVKTPFLDQIGVKVINFGLTPKGLVVQDKMYRPLSVGVLGTLCQRYTYSTDTPIATYDDQLNFLSSRPEVVKALDLNQYEPLGVMDDIQFKFKKLVRVFVPTSKDEPGKNPNLMTSALYMVGEDVSPSAKTGRRHILMPTVGKYLEDVNKYMTFEKELKINMSEGEKPATLTKETLIELSNNGEHMVNVMIDFTNRVNNKDYNFTQDVIKELSVAYRGIYLLEPAKSDLGYLHKMIIKIMLNKSKQLKEQQSQE